MNTSPDLIRAKKALRATILTARDAMPDDARKWASESITQRLIALDAYRDATRVLTYMSFGKELDTQHFFDQILRDRKVAVLPRIDKSTKSLKLHRVESRADLVDGIWGIREPRLDAPLMDISDIDMVLMPGLAFDRTGNRLGYGAGFYDRLLANSADKPVRVAAAFDCQWVDAVPVDAHDRRCHWLVSETQLHQVHQVHQAHQVPA